MYNIILWYQIVTFRIPHLNLLIYAMKFKLMDEDTNK